MKWLIPLLAGAALTVFAAFVLLRLRRSRRLGLSIRMQVFVGMLVALGAFAALFLLLPGLGLSHLLPGTASRLAVGSLLVVTAAACAAAIIGRAVAKPIERLTQAASNIAHGNRQAPLPHPVGREVRTLTAALESMRRELEGRHLAERLAADLSHEIKNPVAAIRAAAEVLADGALDEPDTARHFVERIREATGRLSGIVNNLLALTRVEARGITHEPVDITLLCRQSIDAHAARAERKALRLAFSPGPPADAPIRVIGDPIWLRRAIDNLIDNALGFAESDGREPAVTVSVLPCSSAEAEADAASHAAEDEGRSAHPRYVAIEVKNRGPGVAPEVRDRLFERFVTTRRDSGGTGLGLAIVAAVAEQHGGSVRLVAAGPPETRFRIYLPRDSARDLPRDLHDIFH